jgi:peptidoglycan/LPS O-acetylase OafA/YrhL
LRWLAVAITVLVVPLVLNRPENFRTTCFLFATLFTGTVLYRVTTGELSAAAAAAVLAAAAVAVVLLCVTTEFDAPPGANLRRAEMTTYIGAYAVFVAALLARAAQFPKALLYLGTISYSLYLNHSLVIYGMGWVAHSAYVTVAVWVSLSVVSSVVTYRFIERPGIDIGHRFGRGAASVSSRSRARAS